VSPSIRAGDPVAQNSEADITVTDIVGSDMTAAVSGIHLEAFKGYLNARLGRGYVRALIQWFVGQEGAIALAAVDRDYQVIGYAVGAPVALAQKLRNDLFWVTARSIAVHPWVVLDKRLWKVGFARFRSKSNTGTVIRGPALPEPIMALFGIGVSPSRRQRGVGQQLLRAFEERARELKIGSLLLWVYADRATTRRLYEKCGWHSCPGSVEVTGVTKYVRVLDP
jgi:ribosomal protein S18 acetylase RimI-like enzyme